jgi:hypothetical protein
MKQPADFEQLRLKRQFLMPIFRVPTDRTKKNQALSRTLFDLSNDHLTTHFLRLLYNIILSSGTKKPSVPKLNKINTCSNRKLSSQFLGLLLLHCQLHSAAGMITQSKPYKKKT